MPEYESLLSVPGVGPVIAWTIVPETAEIRRYENVGHLALPLCGQQKDSIGKGKAKAMSRTATSMDFAPALYCLLDTGLRVGGTLRRESLSVRQARAMSPAPAR